MTARQPAPPTPLSVDRIPNGFDIVGANNRLVATVWKGKDEPAGLALAHTLAAAEVMRAALEAAEEVDRHRCEFRRLGEAGNLEDPTNFAALCATERAWQAAGARARELRRAALAACEPPTPEAPDA